MVISIKTVPYIDGYLYRPIWIPPPLLQVLPFGFLAPLVLIYPYAPFSLHPFPAQCSASSSRPPCCYLGHVPLYSGFSGAGSSPRSSYLHLYFRNSVVSTSTMHEQHFSALLSAHPSLIYGCFIPSLLALILLPLALAAPFLLPNVLQ